ncbi:MAG: metal ABC transporter substrate-binding protein [Clostridiales bacterium]|jgi:zinc transport system substrate-binding protein|nr:metal ABC transporter substrate-binding protein [Eubacteriales bacterium]MDH7566374.1 metal ABC transporter substrate-binding protein [Clostridiales bacterium]
MKKTIVKILCLVTALSLLILPGCSAKPSAEKNPADSSGTGTASAKKPSVYTSFYVMYDFTKKIGGDKIDVTNLVPAGTEPHDWEPTPNDIANLEKADVLVYNGAGMEGWLDKVLETLKNKKLIAVETSKEIKLLENADKGGDLKYDSHVWLNPMNAKKQMEAIKNALVTADPSNKDYYEKNYADNAKKLDDLDKEYRDAAAKFTKKDIIVAHQAFGYICNAYGLRQVAIEGLNAESEPSPAKMAEITKFAKENNVKYIFFEELISPKVAEAIAKEVGAKTEVLNPLEGLEEGQVQAGKEYFSVMRENLEALKRALQ